MKRIEINCRNFNCTNNKKGECTQETVQLTPVGGTIDRLICVQAAKRAPEVPFQKGGVKP